MTMSEPSSDSAPKPRSLTPLEGCLMMACILFVVFVILMIVLSMYAPPMGAG